jgi:hypothetical protein
MAPFHSIDERRGFGEEFSDIPAAGTKPCIEFRASTAFNISLKALSNKRKSPAAWAGDLCLTDQ